MPAPPSSERSSLSLPRPRAVPLGAATVITLAFLIPYLNLSLNKFDWAFRPLATGPVFLLFVLALPVNTLLRRVRPRPSRPLPSPSSPLGILARRTPRT